RDLSLTLSIRLSSHHLDLHSFPPRRSSDLARLDRPFAVADPAAPGRRVDARARQSRMLHGQQMVAGGHTGAAVQHRHAGRLVDGDRKSTRLNSSHVKISYAVFCLKKKKNTY